MQVPEQLLTTLNSLYNNVNKKDYVNFMLKPKKHLEGNKNSYTFAIVTEKEHAAAVAKHNESANIYSKI